MIKKIMVSLFILAGMVVSVFANNEGSSSSWSTIYPGNFNFKATYTNGNVAMTWNKFTVPSGKSFAYYKVIRSQTKDNPLYPEDGYIRYDSNLDFTSYTDESPLQGKTYYRVCAILDGQKRYCSNVVKVTITETSSSSETEQEEEVVKQPRTTPTPIKATELSDSTKALLDNIATEFLAKVEAKFGSTSSSAKNGFLTSIIAQLDKLGKRSTKMKPLITYLNAKIEEQIDPLNEIQEILKVE